MKTIIITIMSMTLVLTGCAGEDSETEGSYRSSATPSIDKIAVLEIAWDAQSAEDQATMCWGWDLDEDLMLDTFLEELDPSFAISRSEARNFFEEKC